MPIFMQLLVHHYSADPNVFTDTTQTLGTCFCPSLEIISNESITILRTSLHVPKLVLVEGA